MFANRPPAPGTAARPPVRRPTSEVRLFVGIVVAAGAAVILHSLFTLHTTPRPFEWLIFAALAVLTGSFSMQVASVAASLTVSDTFFITAALLFGPAPATLAVAVDTFVVSLRRRHNWWRMAFNTAAPALSMWLAGRTFFWLARVTPLAQAHAAVSDLVAPLLALTVVYFFLNSGLTAVAIGLEGRQSPIRIWHSHFMWLSLNYLASGSVSFCLILLISQSNLGAIFVILPLLAIFHLTLRSSFGRLEDARAHVAQVDRLYLSTIETLAMAIDAKDDVTHSHVRRVQTYAVGLAKVLGVNDEATLKAIEAAALLHDTGKLAVPEYILNKPGKLTESEFETMKLHVDVGADILSLVNFPYPVVPIVRCHHESWDGSGYPRGVSGEDIPIGARILSVVDCFDALTSDRPYRARMSNEAAFDILRARRGTMYDPRVVDTFIQIQPVIAPAETEPSEHHNVLQHITRSRLSAGRSDVAPAQPAQASVPDDVLAFVSLSRLATGENSVSDVLAIASSLLRDAAANATAAWYIVYPSRNELVVMHASGPAAAYFRELTMPMGARLTGWVAANRQSIVNSDPALDLGSDVPPGPRLQSCLSVPLTSGESLVGVLTLYSPQARAFNEDQGRLVQMIAPHVAQAVCRARSHQAAGEPPATAPAAASLRLVSTR